VACGTDDESVRLFTTQNRGDAGLIFYHHLEISYKGRNRMTTTREEYTAADQGHVYTFYDNLTPAEQTTFDAQLKSISPNKVNAVYAKATESTTTPWNNELEPPPSKSFDSVVGKPELAELWNEIGLNSIRQGQVGVLLMAGGQGSRLGSSAPKGCYDIGLPSQKSLFQLQAERISRLQLIAGRNSIVPWYIMTSGPTRQPTEDFFKSHHYFGLKSENVIFFEQGKSNSFSDNYRFLILNAFV
jgi:UDP-N-acetylglucosamine/UDP-N-acetylgalactosamine diphosphorylase